MKYGYTYWTDKPITPGVHSLALIPQTIFDGWQGFCSCGEWATSVSFHDIPDRDQLLDEIRQRHAKHVDEARKAGA